MAAEVVALSPFAKRQDRRLGIGGLIERVDELHTKVDNINGRLDAIVELLINGQNYIKPGYAVSGQEPDRS